MRYLIIISAVMDANMTILHIMTRLMSAQGMSGGINVSEQLVQTGPQAHQ